MFCKEFPVERDPKCTEVKIAFAVFYHERLGDNKCRFKSILNMDP